MQIQEMQIRTVTRDLAPSTQAWMPFSLWIGIFLLATVFAPLGSATEVYAYLGNPFDYLVSGIYTTVDYVSGDFTTDVPLAANLPLQLINVTSYSFGDGLYDWTNQNSSIMDFSISTDSFGSVSGWFINLTANLNFPDPPYYLPTSNGLIMADFDTSRGDQVLIVSGVLGDGSGLSLLPGKWGPDFDPPPPSAAPEPGSLALMAAGLMALAFVAQKRKGWVERQAC